jgi:secreted trypsin-like serine protease
LYTTTDIVIIQNSTTPTVDNKEPVDTEPAGPGTGGQTDGYGTLDGVAKACGRSFTGFRIVNGTQTEVNEYPWMASLMDKRTMRHFCGGSLITNRYVLSAAHCLRILTSVRTADTILVRLGEYDTRIQTDTNHVVVAVEGVIEHPAYISTPLEQNDIALLRLADSVTFQNNIRPVCLPIQSRITNKFVGQSANVTGWGETSSEDSQLSPVLLEAEVPVLSNHACESTLLSVNPTLLGAITDNVLCAGGRGTESCNGDSGGPLMVLDEERWYQIGVASWTLKCDPLTPGIYTRSTAYIDWINQSIY